MLKAVTDLGVEDPKGKSIEEVQKIMDGIENRVLRLVGEIKK